MGRYASVNEAEVVRSFLESEGIAAFVPDLHMSTILSHAIPFATGGVRVLISSLDFDRAQQLFRENAEALRVEGLSLSTPIDTVPVGENDEAAQLRFFRTSIFSFFVPVYFHFGAWVALCALVKRKKFSLENTHFLSGLIIVLLSTVAWGFVFYLILHSPD